MKPYKITKIQDGEIELLPDIVETPIWEEYSKLDCVPKIQKIAILYMLIEKRENYFQFNSPTAFGNPEYERHANKVCGFCMGYDCEETSEKDKIIFLRKGKKILIVDKIKKPEAYKKAKKENRELLETLGF